MFSVPDHPAVFNIDIDHERKRLRTEIVGRIEFPQAEDFLARKAGEGIMPYSELMDARRAITAITAQDIHRLADILRRIAPSTAFGQVAVVVTDDVTYGMARMMATLIEGTATIRPFRDEMEAEKWLGWLRPDASN